MKKEWSHKQRTSHEHEYEIWPGASRHVVATEHGFVVGTIYEDGGGWLEIVADGVRHGVRVPVSGKPRTRRGVAILAGKFAREVIGGTARFTG